LQPVPGEFVIYQ